MKKFFAMLCLAVLFAATGEARAAVIDFTGGGGGDGDTPGSWQDDYDSLVPGVDVQFNSPYFRWFDDYNNFQAVAIGAVDSPLIIDFVGSVKLNGFGLGNFKNEGAPTRYKIFDQSDLGTAVIDSGIFSVLYDDATKPTYTVNYASSTGIRIELQADPTATIGIDDISFEAFSAAVPEPVTIAIWGIGACGMGIVARRKKKQTV